MAEIGKISVIFGSNTTGFKKGAREVQTGLKQTNKSIDTFKQSIRGIAPALGAAFATRAITQFSKAITGMASENEFAFKKIETLVGMSSAAVNGMKDSVKDLSKETGKSMKELADGLFVVTSAGIRDTAKAMDVLERSSQAARVGLGETNTIARATTAAITAYGEENLNASRATDIFLATVREGNLEAASLAPTIGRVLPLASQLGISFEQVGANIATFTRLGVPAEEAIVGLRGVMSALLTENKDGADALAKVGSSFADIRREVRENGLQSALSHLVSLFDGNEVALRGVIPEIRALTSVLGTAGSQGETYEEIVKNMADSMGLLDEAINETGKTSKDKLAKMHNQLELMGEEMGTKLLPVVIAVKGAMVKVISSFTGFDKAEKTIIATTGVVVTSMLLLKGGVTGVALAFKGLTVAIASNPIGALAVVVGVAGVALANYVRHARIAKNMTIEISEAVEEASESFATIGKKIDTVVNSISDFSLAKAKIELFNAKDLLKKFGDGLIQLSDVQLKAVNDAIPLLESRIKELNERHKEGATILGALSQRLEEQEKIIDSAKPGEEDKIKRAYEMVGAINAEINALKKRDKTLGVKITSGKAPKLSGGEVEAPVMKGSSVDFLKEYNEAIAETAALYPKLKLEGVNTFGELAVATEAYLNKTDAIGSAIVSMGNSMATMFQDIANGEKSMGQAIASMAKQVISVFIAEGIASVIKNTLMGPTGVLGPLALPIAAAAGGAAAGLFNALVPSFADGGIVSSPTLAMIGDARDGRPEYVLNSGQMDNLTRGGGTLSTKFDGRDLWIMYNRENDFRNRN